MATTTIEHVNPADLLVDVNVRDDLQLTKTFLASIRDDGVLQPILAVRDGDHLRVRVGHRRTAAAVDVGLDTVPVIVLDVTTEGDAAEVERLITQHAENEHRTALTTGEQVNIAHQLSLLGVSAAQIARRTHTKRADVDTRLKIGASALAAKATDRYDLTLDQAAAIAEFEDDTDTVTALVAAAKEGRFEHVAARARRDRAEAEAKAPVIEQLTADGITVIERPGYDSPALRMDRLVDADGDPIDVTTHHQCDGHAVYLDSIQEYTEPDGTVVEANRWGDVVWPEGNEPANDEEAERRWEALTVTERWVPVAVCLDPTANGHRDRYDHSPNKRTADQMTDEEREAAKQARRTVIEHNKAWKAARDVRRDWVKTYLTRKTPPATAGGFTATALVTGDVDLVASVGGNHLAAAWLTNADAETYGRSTALAQAVDEASEKRAQVIALGAVLAGYEDRCTDTAWRENGDHSPTGRYLRYLETLGYTLSDVEQYAIASTTV